MRSVGWSKLVMKVCWTCQRPIFLNPRHPSLYLGSILSLAWCAKHTTWNVFSYICSCYFHPCYNCCSWKWLMDQWIYFYLHVGRVPWDHPHWGSPPTTLRQMRIFWGQWTEWSVGWWWMVMFVIWKGNRPYKHWLTYAIRIHYKLTSTHTCMYRSLH